MFKEAIKILEPLKTDESFILSGYCYLEASDIAQAK